MLACKLVWGATIVRLGLNHLSYSSSLPADEVSAAARASQLRFLQQFPGWEPWAEALALGGRS
jgi:hypothetical protein